MISKSASGIYAVSGFDILPGFRALIDQERSIKILNAILQKNRIPHAFLFTGIEGVGKLTAAVTFAMAQNCSIIEHCTTRGEKSELPQLPCCKCKPCKKILTGNHPDIIFIKPSGSILRIDQIRALCHSLSMRPYEATQRVVIISGAHKMNSEAGNALLKILEEPPGKTTFILTATHVYDLLPTVISRCQNIGFNPIAKQNLEKLLVKKYDCSVEDAKILSILGNGSITKALSMKQGNWIIRRNWLIREIELLSQRSIGSIFGFAEKLAQKKDLLSDSFEVIRTYLRDLVVYKFDPGEIINKDLFDRIKTVSEKKSIKTILTGIDALQLAQNGIDTNTNLRLTLEVLVMNLADQIK